MISITKPVNPTPKQLIAFGSPAKKQDWEVRETMLLCVAFAFIKACALLLAAYLTCATEDLLLCGLLVQHTRAYKSLHATQDHGYIGPELWAIVGTYADRVDIPLHLLWNKLCFILPFRFQSFLLCHQHRRAQSRRTVYIVPSLFAGHLPCGICLCQLLIANFKEPLNDTCELILHLLCLLYGAIMLYTHILLSK